MKTKGIQFGTNGGGNLITENDLLEVEKEPEVNRYAGEKTSKESTRSSFDTEHLERSHGDNSDTLEGSDFEDYFVNKYKKKASEKSTRSFYDTEHLERSRCPTSFGLEQDVHRSSNWLGSIAAK